MDKESAISLLKEYVKDERMLQHSYAAEAVMEAIAIKLNQDVLQWALAGLLHDIDIEITNANPKTHGIEAIEILKQHQIPDEVIDAISMHNEEASGKPRTTVFQHALAAGETVTGLIKATAMVYPDKKVASVKAKSVVKRMKEKAFAASVNRENIMECEKIGIPLQEFVELSIEAMCKVADDIGL